MTVVILVTLVVVLALLIAGRRNRASVTLIERRIEHEDRDDA